MYRVLEMHEGGGFRSQGRWDKIMKQMGAWSLALPDTIRHDGSLGNGGVHLLLRHDGEKLPS